MAAIYICGEVSAKDSGDTCPSLEKIKNKLKSMRCSVINPSELPIMQLSWTDTMERRIEQLKKCQAVYVLPNWRESILARIELTVAMDLRIETIFHPASNKEIREIITSLGN